MTTAFEPALPEMMRDFHSDNDSLASLTVSIYTIGYCIGPLIVAPLSEIYGRVMLIYAAYVVFLVTLAICGSTSSLAVLIIFRAIMGFAGLVFVLLGPAMIADFVAKDRHGLAISIVSMGPSLVCFAYAYWMIYVTKDKLTHGRDQHWASFTTLKRITL